MPRIKLCLLNFIVIFSLKILESESENRHLNDRILLQENRHGLFDSFLYFIFKAFIYVQYIVHF